MPLQKFIHRLPDDGRDGTSALVGRDLLQVLKDSKLEAHRKDLRIRRRLRPAHLFPDGLHIWLRGTNQSNSILQPYTGSQAVSGPPQKKNAHYLDFRGGYGRCGAYLNATYSLTV